RSRPASEASGAAFLQERDEKRDRPLEASLPGAGRSSGASEAWPLRARRSSPARDAGGVTPIGPKPANVPRLASNPRRVPPAGPRPSWVRRPGRSSRAGRVRPATPRCPRRAPPGKQPPAQDLHQGGLTGAIFAQHPDDLALVDGHTHVLQGADGSVEGLADVPRLQDGASSQTVTPLGRDRALCTPQRISQVLGGQKNGPRAKPMHSRTSLA